MKKQKKAINNHKIIKYRKKRMKLFKYIVTVIWVYLLIFFINKHDIFKGFTLIELKDYIMSFGVYAPLIYIILFTVVPLTLFPDSLLAITSGMVFGLANGFIFTMIGAICGATLAFYLSRILGRDMLKKIIKKNLDVLEHKLKNNGFMIVLLLRLIPLFPFDMIGYSAGLSEIKYKDFILATLIGIIPGILVFTNIGDQSLNIGSESFYISIALLILLFATSLILKKKLSTKDIT